MEEQKFFDEINYYMAQKITESLYENGLISFVEYEVRSPINIPKLKVAAYCRVSTENSEQQESLETQKNHYENWIRFHSDWEYAGLYYDRGISGTKAECRDGLQNMLIVN